MNKKVYVSNLPSQVTESELNTLFSKAGSVMSVKIVEDRQKPMMPYHVPSVRFSCSIRVSRNGMGFYRRFLVELSLLSI